MIYPIVSAVSFIVLCLAVISLWLWLAGRPFLNSLVLLKNNELRKRTEVAMSGKHNTDCVWSDVAALLMKEARYLKRISAFCNSDIHDTIIRTETFVRKEMAEIIEGELEKNLRDALKALIVAVSTSLFDAKQATGLNYDYFRRIFVAQSEVIKAFNRLDNVAPELSEERARFRMRLMDTTQAQ